MSDGVGAAVLSVKGLSKRFGDRVAFESGGIPVVVVRARDGAVRAYANVCRHRGAPLVRESGPGAQKPVSNVRSIQSVRSKRFLSP